MRQILHDLAARKAAEKHGGGLARAELTEAIEQAEKPLEELIAIDEALGQLRAYDAALCELVEWHYLVGLSLGEIAQIRAVSERTLKRQLATGRVFLLDAMRGV
jgi:DNA-directed RNA polymerase specialized sigma24 family protein